MDRLQPLKQGDTDKLVDFFTDGDGEGQDYGATVPLGQGTVSTGSYGGSPKGEGIYKGSSQQAATSSPCASSPAPFGSLVSQNWSQPQCETTDQPNAFSYRDLQGRASPNFSSSPSQAPTTEGRCQPSLSASAADELQFSDSHSGFVSQPRSPPLAANTGRDPAFLSPQNSFSKSAPADTSHLIVEDRQTQSQNPQRRPHSPHPSPPSRHRPSSRPVTFFSSDEDEPNWSAAAADTTSLLPTPNEPQHQKKPGLKEATSGAHNYATFAPPSDVPVMDHKGKTPASDGWSPYSSQTDMFSNADSGAGKAHGKHEGNRTFIYVLASFATIGGLLFGYDTGIVSGSMLQIAPFFDLSTVWQEIIVSGTIGAAAVFALIAGYVGDWIGRKKTIMIASFVFAAGAIVMAVAPNKEALLGGRIVVGVSIGFASMIVPVYVAEMAPTDIRGRLVTLNQLFVTVGVLTSSIIAGAFSTMEETGWRYMLGLAAVPGVIQLLGFIYLPESPRWLVMKGKEEDAREVLKRIRGHDNIEGEMQEMLEAEANKVEGVALGKILTTPHVRKALLIGCGLQLFQQLCGINTVIYYSATILKNAGFPPDQAVWLVCVPFTVNFFATFIGLWAVEHLGRKLLLIISFLGVTVALIVLGLGFLLSAKHSPAINGTIPVTYINGTTVQDACQNFSVCEDCILNADCGYCYDDNNAGASTCLHVADKDKDRYSSYGRCIKNHTSNPGENIKWAHGFCPNNYTWMAVLGLALFVLCFAPGLGPMPWTINSEIYPMWARGTAVSIATMINWAFNLVVSFSFLSLMEAITKYGTFFLFCGICLLGTLFTAIFVPETKNKSLAEAEELFMTKKKRAEAQKLRIAKQDTIVPDPVDPVKIDTRF